MKVVSLLIVLFSMLTSIGVAQADLSDSTKAPPSISKSLTSSSGGFGVRQSKSVNTNYTAEADGILTVSCFTIGSAFQGFRITANGTTIARTRGNSEGHHGWHSTSAAIKEGEVYRVINDSARDYIINWVPFN